MATKVKFTLADLQARAVQVLDGRISDVQDRLAAQTDTSALEAKVAKWEAQQRARLVQLAKDMELGLVTRDQLATFRLDPRPQRDAYTQRDAERELRTLTSDREKVLAKSSALVPDADGSISLTQTQLSDFFGL